MTCLHNCKGPCIYPEPDRACYHLACPDNKCTHLGVDHVYCAQCHRELVKQPWMTSRGKRAVLTCSSSCADAVLR